MRGSCGIRAFLWVVLIVAVQYGVHARVGRVLGSWDESSELDESGPGIAPESNPSPSEETGATSVPVQSAGWENATGKEAKRGLPTIFRNHNEGPTAATRSDESSSESSSGSPPEDEVTCPSISISETSIMIGISRMPYWLNSLVAVKTQCTNSNGTEFEPVYTELGAGRIVAYRNRGYLRVPAEGLVGGLSCGEKLDCKHQVIYRTAGGLAGYDIPGYDCGYDYRVFIQWGYEQPDVAFTCEDPGTFLFTLACVECQSPTFDWELAYNMSGEVLEKSSPSNSTFNYILVITAVCGVGFIVLVAFVAMVIRGRRRSRIDRDVAAMLARQERERGERGEEDKPPELFEVGDSEDGDGGCVEMTSVGKDYKGPIVVKYDVLVEPDIEAGAEAGASGLGDGSQSMSSEDPLMSRNTSKTSTNWTLTQIAVLDDEMVEEVVEGDEGGVREGESVGREEANEDENEHENQTGVERSQETTREEDGAANEMDHERLDSSPSQPSRSRSPSPAR